MNRPRLIVFASGTKTGGGTGFANLVAYMREGKLEADIVAVVSNHEHGGVREKADKLKIPFHHFADPYTAEGYRKILEMYGARFVVLSGWLKLVSGLDQTKTINIHPGPLPDFGGPGMYGRHVHEAVLEAYKRGEIKTTRAEIHFVTEEYDKGPSAFRSHELPIKENDTPETLAKRVHAVEERWLPIITNMMVRGKIIWTGHAEDPVSGAIDFSGLRKVA